MKAKNKYTFNFFTFMLLVLFIVTLVNDYLTFFLNIPYLVGIILSFIGVFIVLYLCKSKIKLTIDFNKFDIIFYIVLLAIFLITFVYPDIAFDSINYHIYLQEHPFGDKIFGDFFAGKNLNSFSYAFPDRIHYIFRYFLGFRLGVLCNYLVLLVLFYQTKDIMKQFIKNKNECLITIISMLSVFSLSIVELIDNYYIDLFSLVTLMEIIRLLLKEEFIENNKYQLFKTSYLALLFGFAIAIKISNLPLLGLFFILFLIKTKFSFRKLNYKIIISILASGIIPFILYFTYTYLKTGNPVFPFYNTIFKSPYYALSNWMDTRFGPHSIKETLLWPILMFFKPNRAVDSAVVEHFWMSGYVISIFYLIYFGVQFLRKKEIDKDKLFLMIIVILVNLVWSKFELGYTRYGLPVILLSNICFYIFLIDIFNKKKYFVLGILCIFWFANFSYSSYHFLYSKEHWLFNNKYQQDRGTDYVENVKKMFQFDNPKIELPQNSVWGIINYNAAYTTMVNQNNPMINLNSSVSNETTQEILNNHLNDKRIFTMTDVLNFQNFITYLNNADYYISNYYNTYNPSFMRYRERLYVFEIEKKVKKNTYSGINTTYTQVLDKDANSVSFIAGIEKSLVENMNEGYHLEVKKTHQKQEEVLDILEIGTNGELVNYQRDVSLVKGDSISITILDKEKKEFLDDRWFMLINFEIHENK